MKELVYYNIQLDQLILLNTTMYTLIDIADRSEHMIYLGEL